MPPVPQRPPSYLRLFFFFVFFLVLAATFFFLVLAAAFFFLVPAKAFFFVPASFFLPAAGADGTTALPETPKVPALGAGLNVQKTRPFAAVGAGLVAFDEVADRPAIFLRPRLFFEVARLLSSLWSWSRGAATADFARSGSGDSRGPRRGGLLTGSTRFLIWRAGALELGALARSMP